MNQQQEQPKEEKDRNAGNQGQVVAPYVLGDASKGEFRRQDGGSKNDDDRKITIGEALEASGRITGNEFVQPSDVVAIREAEDRASHIDVLLPGGISDQATAAASANIWETEYETKVKLRDVLSDAPVIVPGDNPVEQADAAGVMDAEIASKPDARPRPGGVAAAMAIAARINRDNNLAN